MHLTVKNASRPENNVLLVIGTESLINISSRPSSRCNLTTKEWIAVLDLATKWKMELYRRTAITCLSTTAARLTPEEELHLALKYRVREWFVPTLNELAQRPEPMGPKEHELLGTDCVLKLCAVRERFPHCTCMSEFLELLNVVLGY